MREIDIALRHWIESYFSNDNHVLMPAYALDTARFVQFHLEGHYGHSPEPWQIKPIVDLPDADLRFSRFIDARFKKEFTERMGTLNLCATVPQNCKIVRWSGEEVLAAGNEFLFNTQRCHLSSGFYDHTYLKCEEDDEQRYDLHEEFCFMGAVFSVSKDQKKFATKQDLLTSSDLDFHGHKIELPAHWIDGVVDLPDRYPYDRPLLPKILGIPRWDAEID
jgi:hypothetical protein